MVCPREDERHEEGRGNQMERDEQWAKRLRVAGRHTHVHAESAIWGARADLRYIITGRSCSVRGCRDKRETVSVEACDVPRCDTEHPRQWFDENRVHHPVAPCRPSPVPPRSYRLAAEDPTEFGAIYHNRPPLAARGPFSAFPP